MMLLAKAALTVGGALVLAGAYTMREGVIRIDVDEYRAGGSHVHMWVPAAAVPMVLHFVPTEHLRHGSEILERLIRNDGLLVVGAEYSLETGEVEFFDALFQGLSTQATPAPAERHD